MKKGAFIWADLSTYNTQKSIQFYKNVFAWQIEDVEQYNLASLKEVAIAGIFETPNYLQKINMPHFWMSYFQVENVAQTVAIAKTMNAIIEVDSTPFYKGNIALIRDPQGAGFTIYDGKELNFNTIQNGAITKTELHVSNLQNVSSFYIALFDWNIAKENNGHVIYIDNSKTNISIQEINNSIKGKYEYWVTTIKVDSLQKYKQLILDYGGTQIMKEEKRLLMSDNSGEAFFYIEE